MGKKLKSEIDVVLYLHLHVFIFCFASCYNVIYDVRFVFNPICFEPYRWLACSIASSAVDHGFDRVKPDYTSGICCFSDKYAALRRNNRLFGSELG